MADDLPKPGRIAWITVAVLWPVAFFYYFDRLLITSMRDAIRVDIVITDAQFGLLTRACFQNGGTG